MIFPMVAGKLVAGITAVILASFITPKNKIEEPAIEQPNVISE